MSQIRDYDDHKQPYTNVSNIKVIINSFAKKKLSIRYWTESITEEQLIQFMKLNLHKNLVLVSINGT